MSRWLPLIRLTRSYSLPYVALLALVAPATSVPRESWALLSLGPCLWILGAALNDMQHREADAVARPERKAADHLLLPVIVVTGILSFTTLAHQGLLALSAGGASIAAAGLYGFTKSVPFVSMLTRGLASSCLAVAGAAGMGTQPNWYVVAAVGILDAAGNGLGDLRDLEKDRRSGTRTLAVLHPGLALGACQVLHLVALRLFALGHGGDPPGWFALGLVGLMPMLVFDDESKHGGYLLFKYFTLVLHFASAARLELAVLSAAAVPLATGLYTLSHGTRWAFAFRAPRRLSRIRVPARTLGAGYRTRKT